MFELVLYLYLERSLSHVATYATKAQCEAHLPAVRDIIGDTKSSATAFCTSIFPRPVCLVTGGGKS